jgi:hypothetical protein
VHDYALANDFEVPPPLLLVSDGRTFEMYERTSVDAAKPLYERLPRVLRWEEVCRRSPGRYSPTFVDLRNLVRLFRTYADRIEGEIRPQVLRLAEAAKEQADEVEIAGRRFDRSAICQVGKLFEEKTEAASGSRADGRRRPELRQQGLLPEVLRGPTCGGLVPHSQRA